MLEKLICIVIIAILLLLVINVYKDIINSAKDIVNKITTWSDMMDKFKMELTWHNCKTYPPKETFNSWLLITDGHNVDHCSYYNKYGFPVPENKLHKYWWSDISRTVKECTEFKESVNV